jgi:hypothetical protein
MTKLNKEEKALLKSFENDEWQSDFRLIVFKNCNLMLILRLIKIRKLQLIYLLLI